MFFAYSFNNNLNNCFGIYNHFLQAFVKSIKTDTVIVSYGNDAKTDEVRLVTFPSLKFLHFMNSFL